MPIDWRERADGFAKTLQSLRRDLTEAEAEVARLTAERDALRAQIAAMQAPDNSRFEFHRGWNGAVAAILARIDNPTTRQKTAV